MVKVCQRSLNNFLAKKPSPKAIESVIGKRIKTRCQLGKINVWICNIVQIPSAMVKRPKVNIAICIFDLVIVYSDVSS